jgi:hypothetical protein
MYMQEQILPYGCGNALSSRRRLSCQPLMTEVLLNGQLRFEQNRFQREPRNAFKLSSTSSFGTQINPQIIHLFNNTQKILTQLSMFMKKSSEFNNFLWDSNYIAFARTCNLLQLLEAIDGFIELNARSSSD